MRRRGRSGRTSVTRARSSGKAWGRSGVVLGGAAGTSTTAGGNSVGMAAGSVEGASPGASTCDGSADHVPSEDMPPARGQDGQVRRSRAGACGAISGRVRSGKVRWVTLARPSTSPTVAGTAQRVTVVRPNRRGYRARAPRLAAGREYDQPRLEYTRVPCGLADPGGVRDAMSRGGHKQVRRGCATTPLYRARPARATRPSAAFQGDGALIPAGIARSPVCLQGGRPAGPPDAAGRIDPLDPGPGQPECLASGAPVCLVLAGGRR